jgi:autotransporter-associated beta strand protein
MSWVGGQAPGPTDIARWDATVTSINVVSMGADLGWQGLVIANPGGEVKILSGQTLTLGRAGIDMSAATVSITNTSGLRLLAGAQVWNVQSGRTLSLTTGAFARTAGATLSFGGVGTVAVSLTGMSNDLSFPSPGILGPWAVIANPITNAYATLAGGNIVAYTGVASPFNWPAASVASNYDITALSGAIDASRSANTVRYLGVSGTQTYGITNVVVLTLNGLMNAGSGTLTLAKGGTGIGTGLMIATNRELVLNAATAPIVLSMPVFDSSSGASALTVAGSFGVTLTVTNTFSGVTSITGGTLTLGHPAALQNSILNYDNLGGTLSFGTLTAATLAGLKGAQNLGITNVVSAPITLTINNGTSMTNAGALLGSGGLVKNGAGTWMLTATNTYTGPTTVSNGTLLVSGSLASPSLLVAGGRLALSGSGSLTCTNVNVASGAIFDVSALLSPTFTLGGNQSLQGSGTVTGNVATVASGPSIYPGRSGIAGTLTFSNALNLGLGGAIYFDLSGAANSGNDKVVVGKNLNLSVTNVIHINALTAGGILATNADYVLFAVSGTTTMTVPLLVWDGTPPANYANYSLLQSGNNVVLHYNASTVISTTLVVTNLNDSGSGSLRQALLDASELAGDTISFAPGVAGKLILTNGELLVAKPLTIAGPGAGLLAISGNSAHRVFHLTNSTALTNPTVINISGVTICDGRILGTNGPAAHNGENVTGGGILNEATLLLMDCVISNNVATGGAGGPTNQFGAGGNGGNASGGGIETSGGLTMNQCTLVSNAATGGLSGTNAGGGQGYGAGLYCESGDTVLIACTISGNNANAGPGLNPGFGAGGGIYTTSPLWLTNCTVANNAAIGSGLDEGGGIDDYGGITLRSCTVSGNQADYGGGVHSGSADVGNSILAGNAATALAPDFEGTIASSDYNLIQNANGASFTGATNHNLLGLNPLLGPLQDNGGPTHTMALLPGSPAIDKGISFSLATDQRGGVRPFDKSVANASGGDGSDIGAFEVGSYIFFTDVRRVGNDVRVSFTTDAANSYTLQRRADLTTGSWTNVIPNIAGTGSIITMTNFGAASLPGAFYRGQALP